MSKASGPAIEMSFCLPNSIRINITEKEKYTFFFWVVLLSVTAASGQREIVKNNKHSHKGRTINEMKKNSRLNIHINETNNKFYN